MKKPYEANIAQDESEISAYCDILRQEEVSLYLEIGSKYGGSLWRAAMAMPVGSRIVSIDLPNGTKAWKESSASLKACIDELNVRGYKAEVIWGDSRATDVIRKAEMRGPYHAVMIDADHRLPGVTADWINYGPMSRNIVAFHDISWRRAPDWVGTRIDVPEFWDAIKHDYRHRELKMCPSGKNNGIGVLWKD
jgi:predicted O-methyltransferase YrrM